MALATRYKGIAFPFRKGAAQFPETATDDELVRQSMEQIVRTARGERVYRTRMGCSAAHYVFENNTPVMGALLARSAAEAIRDNEPRVDVLDVQVQQQESSAIVTVFWAMNGRSQAPLTVEV